MTDPTTGALRWTRSSALTVVVLALAATAHVLAGGALPSPLILTALAVATTCVTHTVTRRRLSTPTVLGLLGGGQLLLHTAFDTFASTSTVTPVAGHQHSSTQITAQITAQITDATAASTPMEAMTSDATMLVAHVLATLGTGLVLAHGERTLWALLGWLTPLVRVLRLALVPLTCPPTLRPRDVPHWEPHALVLARDVDRRGPPTTLTRA